MKRKNKNSKYSYEIESYPLDGKKFVPVEKVDENGNTHIIDVLVKEEEKPIYPADTFSVQSILDSGQTSLFGVKHSVGYDITTIDSISDNITTASSLEETLLAQEQSA